jgi:hypothetical protein
MSTRGIASSAVAIALLVSRAAGAQAQYTPQGDSPEWLKDRRSSQGIGIRTGDLEIHPGIAGEAGYDSNYLLRSTTQNVANGPPLAPVIPALEFRITPSLYLSTLSPARRDDDTLSMPPPLMFRMGMNATYRELVGVSSDPTSSQPQNDIASQRNVSGSADARLDILPGRPVGGAVFASYARAILPNTVDANPDISFNQDNFGGGAELALQPGSGTLDWHFGYTFNATIFEEQAGRPYNNVASQIYTRGRWKFRPRTALIYDGNVRFVTYGSEATTVTVPLDTSTPIRARLGVEGLLTDRFAILAMAGWGASFYSAAANLPQFDSIIAQGELKWFLSASPGIAKATELGLALSSIAVGYTRDFQNSYFGSYYTQDRGYLKFYYQFAGRAIVSLEGGVAAIEYPTLFWSDGNQRHSSFSDLRADATLFSEYRFTDTFGLNATLRFSANASNTLIPIAEVPVAGTENEYAMQWNRFEAYIGVRWFM